MFAYDDCVARIEVAGIEVVGIEVVGMEVAGIEVVGMEVAGIEVAGMEVAGIVAPDTEDTPIVGLGGGRDMPLCSHIHFAYITNIFKM